MFHGLAGLIFGGKTEEAIETPAGREETTTVKNNREDGLEIVDDLDEEWEMIEVKRDETALAAAIMTQSAIDLDLALPILLDGTSGESSPTADERGWNLTPPPCFTASFNQREKQRLLAADENKIVAADGGESKRKTTFGEETNVMNIGGGDDRDEEDDVLNSVLETSNFENLLIEHPSMSVYGRIHPNIRHRSGRTTTTTQGIFKNQQQQQQPKKLVEQIVSLKEKKIEEKSTSSMDETVFVRQRPVANMAELLLGVDLSMIAARRVDLDKQQRQECAYQTKEMGMNNRMMRRMNAVANSTTQGNNCSGSQRKRRMKNQPAGRCNDRKCQ